MPMKFIILIVFTFLFCGDIESCRAQKFDQLKKSVYIIYVSGRPGTTGTAALSGFKINGIPGIVTSLHGVLGQKNFLIRNNASVRYKSNIRISKISIAHDLAIVTSEEIDKIGGGLDVRTTPLTSNEQLAAIGFPSGIDWIKTDLKLEPSIEAPLTTVCDDESRPLLAARQSPDVNERVLKIDGSLSPGYSGAPIVDINGKVIGVGLGGVRGGAPGISWAIPIRYVLAVQPYQETAAVAQLKQSRNENLFSFETSSRQNVEKIGRLSVVFRLDQRYEFVKDHPRKDGQTYAAMFVAHPPIMRDKIAVGFAYYSSSRYTVTNTFTTLSNYQGRHDIDYVFNRSKAFVRYYCYRFDDFRLFNAYVGAGINFLGEIPVDKSVIHLDNSETFREDRKENHPTNADYFIGVRFAKKWYTLEMEASYLPYARKSENFVFNVFGNAVAKPQTDRVKQFCLSLNCHINLSFLQ